MPVDRDDAELVVVVLGRDMVARRPLSRPDGGGLGRPRQKVTDQGWFARIEWTSAPSEIVDEKKLITSSPAIVSRPM